jgi:hypothetical protein
MDLPEPFSFFHPAFTKILIRLTREYNLYPECLSMTSLEAIGTHAVASGGFGDVWRAVWQGLPGGNQRIEVAVKVTRVYANSEIKKLLKVR